jgi:hypothetical protein
MRASGETKLPLVTGELQTLSQDLPSADFQSTAKAPPFDRRPAAARAVNITVLIHFSS